MSPAGSGTATPLRRGPRFRPSATVLVVAPAIRTWMAKAVRHRVADMTVLSYSEIPDEQAVKVINTVVAEKPIQ